MNAPRLSLFFILILTASSIALAPTPPATAQATPSFAEDFESIPTGSPAKGSWYSAVDNMGATVPVVATTLTGYSHAISYDGTAGKWIGFTGTNRALDLCTLNSAFSFTVYLPDLTAGNPFALTVKGHTNDLRSYQGSSNDFGHLAESFYIASDGAHLASITAVNAPAGPGASQIMGDVATPAAYKATITNVVCSSIQTRFTFTFGSLGPVTLNVNAPMTAILSDLYAIAFSTNSIGSPIYLDNLAWTGLGAFMHGANYEDFNSYQLSATPSKPFYAFTTTRGNGVAYPGIVSCDGAPGGTSANLGSKCAYVPPASQEVFQSLGGDFCPTQIDPTGVANLPTKLGFDFAMGNPAYATNGWTQIQLTDSLTAPRNTITLQALRISDGTVGAQLQITANGAQVLSNIYTNVFNPFYDHLNLVCRSVPGGAGTHLDSVAVYFDSHQGAAYGHNFAAGDNPQTIFTAPLTYLVVGNLNCQSCGATMVDNLDFPGNGAIITPTAQAATPGLVGFNVDPFDQSVIIRQANATGGQDVRAQDPGSFRTSGTLHEPNCNRVGGVATRYSAGKVFESFLDCDSTNNVNVLHIRDQNLGPPDESGTPCAGESFCESDISGPFGGNAPPSNARDLGRIEAAPWDYSLGSTEPTCALCVKHVTLSWAYDEISGGHVGLYALTMNKNLPDQAVTATQIYAPQGSVLNDFCAWRDTTTQQDYMVAASNTGATKIYQASVHEQANGLAHQPVATLTLIYPGNGGFDNAASLGCARDRILVVTNDGHAILTTIQGHLLATFPAPSPMQHSAAMSLDGAFGIFGSAGFYHVVDLVNMTDVLQIPVPSGGLYATSLDFNAKTLWSATNSQEARYSLGALLHTQSVPLGANRNLTTGALLSCTDAQGRPSSTCTGIADPPLTTGTGTGTGTTSGSGTSTASSTTTSTGTGGTSGSTTGTGASGTSGTNSTGNSTSSAAGGGGGGVVDLAGGPTPLLLVAAVALVAAAVVVVIRRRFA